MCATTAPLRSPGSSRVRAASNRDPRSALRDPRKVRTRQFSGSTPSTAPSASTTTSSTCAARARIFGTVAASAGCRGSTCCVMKRTLVTNWVKTQCGCEAAAFRDLRAHGDPALADLRACALEEVEVAEREVPRARVLVEAGVFVEPLADETELLVRRRKACPDDSAAMRRSARWQEDQRVGAALDLLDGAGDQRAYGRGLVGRDDEIGEE